MASGSAGDHPRAQLSYDLPGGILGPLVLIGAAVAMGPVNLVATRAWANPGSDLLAVVVFVIFFAPGAVILYNRGNGLYLVGGALEHRRRGRPAVKVCSAGDVDHLLARKTKLGVIGHQEQEIYRLDNNWKLDQVAAFADQLGVKVVRDY